MSKGLQRSLVVLYLALSGAACDIKVGERGLSVDLGGGRASDEWVRTYTIQPGGRLEVTNVNGPVRVIASASAQVEVRAAREVRAASEEAAREFLQKAEMREAVAPDRVSIESPGGRDGFTGPTLTVRYEIRVPAGLTVSAKTQNGEVRIEDVSGRFIASSTNGGINARAVSGSLDASTVNGGIQADLASVTADSRLTTVNGGIRLDLPAGAGAELDAAVVNGGVSVDEALRLVDGQTSRQRVSGRLGSGGPRIVLQTTNGGVRVASRQPATP